MDVGQRVRTFDELNLRRLSWFVTLPGFALFLAGVAVVALRRWRASAWMNASGPAPLASTTPPTSFFQ